MGNGIRISSKTGSKMRKKGYNTLGGMNIYQQIRLEVLSTSEERRRHCIRWFHRLAIRIGYNVHVFNYMRHLSFPDERWVYSHWRVGGTNGVWDIKPIFSWFFMGLEGDYKIGYCDRDLDSKLEKDFEDPRLSVLLPNGNHDVYTLSLIHI